MCLQQSTSATRHTTDSRFTNFASMCAKSWSRMCAPVSESMVEMSAVEGMRDDVAMVSTKVVLGYPKTVERDHRLLAEGGMTKPLDKRFIRQGAAIVVEVAAPICLNHR